LERAVIVRKKGSILGLWRTGGLNLWELPRFALVHIVRVRKERWRKSSGLEVYTRGKGGGHA